MKKNKFLKKVKEFHNTFGAPVLNSPQIPNKERSDLRVSLIKEELSELEEAISRGDIVEVSDALGDLMVVLSGTILEFGLGDKFNDIFNEIHKSNMSKAASSMEEAEETLHKYLEEGIKAHSVKVGDKWVILRTDDDKVLKSIKYKKVNLEKILNK
jgi:predicted HAD superfamily Cof-like phosphohydrolase